MATHPVLSLYHAKLVLSSLFCELYKKATKKCCPSAITLYATRRYLIQYLEGGEPVTVPRPSDFVALPDLFPTHFHAPTAEHHDGGDDRQIEEADGHTAAFRHRAGLLPAGARCAS